MDVRVLDVDRRLHRRALHSSRYWRGEGDRREAAYWLNRAAQYRRQIAAEKGQP